MRRPPGVFALAGALMALGASAALLAMWAILAAILPPGPPRAEGGGWIAGDPEGWAMIGIYIFSFIGACGLLALLFGSGLWRGWRWTRWAVIVASIGGASWCAGFAAIVMVVNPADFDAIGVVPLIAAPALGAIGWYFTRPQVAAWFASV